MLVLYWFWSSSATICLLFLSLNTLLIFLLLLSSLVSFSDKYNIRPISFVLNPSCDQTLHGYYKVTKSFLNQIYVYNVFDSDVHNLCMFDNSAVYSRTRIVCPLKWLFIIIDHLDIYTTPVHIFTYTQFLYTPQTILCFGNVCVRVLQSLEKLSFRFTAYSVSRGTQSAITSWTR